MTTGTASQRSNRQILDSIRFKKVIKDTSKYDTAWFVRSASHMGLFYSWEFFATLGDSNCRKELVRRRSICATRGVSTAVWAMPDLLFPSTRPHWPACLPACCLPTRVNFHTPGHRQPASRAI